MIMSSLPKSGKSAGISSSPVGFRFHTNDEELEELKSGPENCTQVHSDMNLESKSKPTLQIHESKESKSDEDKSDAKGDPVRDLWNLLGRKSAGIDANYESPFSNPIETWRKLNELKGKITKTVEKISEGKMERHVTGSSSCGRLFNSKENSSISDSEDTSESSKLSESLKDNEEQNLSLKKVNSKNSELLSSTLEATVQKVKAEMEREAELRNRKSTRFSELLKPSDIKIATPRKDTATSGSLFQESLEEEVESGVEADENLEPSESDSLDMFDDTCENLDGSETPPPGGVSRIWNNFDVFTTRETFMLMVSLGLYVLLPMPDFVRGFLFCLCCVFCCLRVKTYFQIDDPTFQPSRTFVMPDYKSLPPLKVPEYKPVSGVWVNEYMRDTYNPDYYSVTHTLPAYLELDKSTLKISRPKGKINKRATFDEPEYKLQFVSQRIYNISGCNVFLMPDGLTRKRLYSKKYPIVIFLRPDSLISVKKNGKNIDDKEKQYFVDLEENSNSNLDILPNRINLYIFARCDRQKEEWYRRLLAASRYSGSQKILEIPSATSEEKEGVDNSTSDEAITPFENLFFDGEVTQLEEYIRYMSKVLNIEAFREDIKYMKSRPSWYKKLRKKRDGSSQENGASKSSSSVKSSGVRSSIKNQRSTLSRSKIIHSKENCDYSIQVQWFSAFINRILFDIFRSPYWLRKIHEKVQRKLNSIRLPYYIEDIEVTEMDLGKTGPVFQRVSQPYLDERGLWFDMDITYEGLIKLTIQTHLNLVKLQQGMTDPSEFSETEKLEKSKKVSSKEVKDSNLTKEPRELTKKIRKLEKKALHAKSSTVRKHAKFETGKKDSSPDRHFTNDRKLLDEVARFAEIAIEEVFGDSVESVESEKVKHKTSVHYKETNRSPIYDSEVEDSAESSEEEEEEEEEISPVVSTPSAPDRKTFSFPRRYPRDRRSSKRIFRVFENVAQSKYFKSMAQSKYVQKAIAGVSATKLRLTLEIKSCTGTLTLNIPPPPSDRFWYGFREMPKMVFSANPKIGGKSVRFVHIKNYLQKKILHEIKKAMVVPNMVDFVLPTSSPAQSSSSLQVEQQTQDEEDSTPSQEEK